MAERVPLEVVELILRRVEDLEDVVHCRQVCKLWREAADDLREEPPTEKTVFIIKLQDDTQDDVRDVMMFVSQPDHLSHDDWPPCGTMTAKGPWECRTTVKKAITRLLQGKGNLVGYESMLRWVMSLDILKNEVFRVVGKCISDQNYPQAFQILENLDADYRKSDFFTMELLRRLLMDGQEQIAWIGLQIVYDPCNITEQRVYAPQDDIHVWEEVPDDGADDHVFDHAAMLRAILLTGGDHKAVDLVYDRVEPQRMLWTLLHHWGPAATFHYLFMKHSRTAPAVVAAFLGLESDGTLSAEKRVALALASGSASVIRKVQDLIPSLSFYDVYPPSCLVLLQCAVGSPQSLAQIMRLTNDCSSKRKPEEDEYPLGASYKGDEEDEDPFVWGMEERSGERRASSLLDQVSIYVDSSPLSRARFEFLRQRFCPTTACSN